MEKNPEKNGSRKEKWRKFQKREEKIPEKGRKFQKKEEKSRKIRKYSRKIPEILEKGTNIRDKILVNGMRQK